MMKKILLGALTILFTLCMFGCGGGDKPADKPAAPAEKKEVSADKAIVTYAELIATGESANDIGLTEEEKAEVAKEFANDLVTMFELSEIPVNEQTVKNVAEKFQEKLKKEMKFTATIKKDDAEHPVVELKTTPVDSTSEKVIRDEIKTVLDMKEKLQKEGATDEQIKNNADFQKLTTEVYIRFFNSMPLKDEQTFEVNCTKVNGHWAPADVKALKQLFM